MAAYPLEDRTQDVQARSASLELQQRYVCTCLSPRLPKPPVRYESENDDTISVVDPDPLGSAPFGRIRIPIQGLPIRRRIWIGIVSISARSKGDL
jgi:hypothetical protein